MKTFLLDLWLKIIKYINLVNFIDDNVKMLLKFRFSSLSEKIFIGRIALLGIYDFSKRIGNIKVESIVNG